MRTPLELFYTILLIFGAAILGALIVLPFSAAYNYGSLNFSVSYNFNGMGPGIEDAYKKNYLLLSEEGIQGMLSLKWKQVQSLVYYDVPEVLLTISRRPLWLYNLFGMNTVRLRFTTDGDAQRFRAKLLHYKPSLSIKPAHPTTPEFVV